jgi:hypothetical protein
MFMQVLPLSHMQGKRTPPYLQVFPDDFFDLAKFPSISGNRNDLNQLVGRFLTEPGKCVPGNRRKGVNW